MLSIAWGRESKEAGRVASLPVSAPGSAPVTASRRRTLIGCVAVALVLGAFRLSPAWAAWTATDTNAANSFNANGSFPALYHPQIISDGPWFYHEMDDASGNTATDSSGNGRAGTYSASTGSGTLTSAPGATTGDGDTALTFGGATANNGTAGTGVCGYAVSDVALATSTTFTIEAWFRTANPTGGMIVNSGWYTTQSGFTPTAELSDAAITANYQANY